MNKLKGLKISLCQMNVVPGRPDLNSAYIINEIQKAAEREINIIIFPELATSGYLIADKFEDKWFADDVQRFNQEIINSVPNDLVAIFGTIVVSNGNGSTTLTIKGEDGRHRMHNAAIIAQGRKALGHIVKTLQPHYR